MRKKQMLKAIKSETPINSMYSLIPTDKRNAFKRFASCFGFTEERIKKIEQKRSLTCWNYRFYKFLSIQFSLILQELERIIYSQCL